LAQTIFWCAPRANVSNPKDCLRTPELRPRIFEESRFSAVDTVAVERERYGGVKIRQAKVPRDLAGGRLLIYFPNINLYDGAAEDETLCFLDVDNLPPWDTWIAYFEEETDRDYYGCYLVAWIPSQFVDLVSDGINVNPEECIMWLSDANVSFAQKLRREGLLV
jgi:hypothetical protein